MIFNGKSNPLLPPVINKHKKNPSMAAVHFKESTITERPYSRSMNPAKSELALPKIFRANLLEKVRSRIEEEKHKSPDFNQTNKIMVTPCFNNTRKYSKDERNNFMRYNGSISDRDPSHKYFMDTYITNLSEVSFGESSQMENFRPSLAE